MEKVFTKNKTLESGGRLRKNLYPLVLNYYQLFYIRTPQPLVKLCQIGVHPGCPKSARMDPDLCLFIGCRVPDW